MPSSAVTTICNWLLPTSKLVPEVILYVAEGLTVAATTTASETELSTVMVELARAS